MQNKYFMMPCIYISQTNKVYITAKNNRKVLVWSACALHTLNMDKIIIPNPPTVIDIVNDQWTIS